MSGVPFWSIIFIGKGRSVIFSTTSEVHDTCLSEILWRQLIIEYFIELNFQIIFYW